MQLIFGIGALWGTSLTNPSAGPDQFAILQENSIDFTFELKELYSQLQFPVDIARGKGKITGKAKMARVFGALYADMFFGENDTTGQTVVSEDGVVTLTTTTTTVTFATSFVADLGVYYNATGRMRFNYVTGAPAAAGQYTTGVNGVYTFFSADIGQQVAISYVFTAPGGNTITINNHFMGFTPAFQATFYQNQKTLNSTGQLTLRLNACVSSHLTFPSKLDDYGIPDFDYMAFSAGNNIIGTLSTTE